MCVSLISAITWLAFCKACGRNKDLLPHGATGRVPLYIRGRSERRRFIFFILRDIERNVRIHIKVTAWKKTWPRTQRWTGFGRQSGRLHQIWRNELGAFPRHDESTLTNLKKKKSVHHRGQVDICRNSQEADNKGMPEEGSSINHGELAYEVESVTCIMSAASMRRWAMSSDSVSRLLRRPDLYSWPTSSLWRLSFKWLTRKCITAFGTLRGREETERTDGWEQGGEMAGWGSRPRDGGARVWPTKLLKS